MTTSRGPLPVATLGGQEIPFIGPARIYVCGVTPYDVTHLGHAATYVWIDALTRVLKMIGVDTVTCRNVTDVDDVLTAAAARAGVPFDRFAAISQFEFERDMAALAVTPPVHQPRAHEFVPGVIALVSALVTASAAYVRDGNVYFRGAATALAGGRDRADAEAAAAAGGDAPEDPAKEDPLDTAVWKASSPGEPSWDSPWGPGRPGWHAECAAMALGVLGPAVDLHAGGEDLRFPHHAHVAALASAVTSVRPFARSYLHVGTVGLDGRKMAKSAGNLVLVSDLLEQVSAGQLRTLLLDRPYERPWDYTPEALDVAGGRLDDLRRAATRPPTSAGGRAAARAALLDGLNVGRSIDIAVDAGGDAARLVLGILEPEGV